ncbi:aKG-HExxH-type peptide beta-hydroxylase [Rhizobium mayense]|uniref:HEXXH motif-containing putative peptide modification protein n=1 Tax=Rhizobium mayense TaxID=1312184 RepID=A0ABT7K5T8_9HYPH|nr:HEXXH motif-containing putative peptide modification protein [Rhizobium mayense]MDL2403978.1 HEXXH motif-containing putative peptide modification protein [Rhizobium mayense]
MAVPSAARLLHELQRSNAHQRYRVVGDTVVRAAIEHARRYIDTGIEYGIPIDQCERIFSLVADDLSRGLDEPLGFAGGVRLPSPYDTWIWTNNRSTAEVGHAHAELVRLNYGGELVDPSDEEVEYIRSAAGLLRQVMPESSYNALRHVQVVAVFANGGAWKRTASSSEFRLTGTIFLSRRFLKNIWWTAEHLLHEALHQQLYDLRHTHSILQPGYDFVSSPKVHSPWNTPPGNQWDLHRTMAAYHVYVYLAIFGSVVEALEEPSEFGPRDAMGVAISGSVKAAQRARYLYEQLRSVGWSQLGEAGRRFVDILAIALDDVEKSPAPTGARLHLLIDRYRKEANLIESVPSRMMDHCEALNRIAEDEVKCTNRILTDLGLGNSATIAYLAGECVDNFPAVRRAIAMSLLGASTDGYTLATPQAEAMVNEMVERSSSALTPILTS